MKKALAGLFVLTLLAGPCQAAEPLTVTRVIDSDIILLSNGEKVRLIGVDVPANMKKKASEFTRELVGNSPVWPEYDMQYKDKDGSTLAYVYSPRGAVNMEGTDQNGERVYSSYLNEDVFLNAELIKAGYAKAMILPPNVKHAELFLEMESQAKENKRGLWAESQAEGDQKKGLLPRKEADRQRERDEGLLDGAHEYDENGKIKL